MMNFVLLLLVARQSLHPQLPLHPLQSNVERKEKSPRTIESNQEVNLMDQCNSYLHDVLSVQSVDHVTGYIDYTSDDIEVHQRLVNKGTSIANKLS